MTVVVCVFRLGDVVLQSKQNEQNVLTAINAKANLKMDLDDLSNLG